MNYIKKFLGIALVLICSNTLTTPNKVNTKTQIATPSFHLHNVFFTDSLRKELSQFIDNVLKQIPSKQFFDFIDTTEQYLK